MTEPTADQIISLIEGIARDPVLKPAYQRHASQLAAAMRVLPLRSGSDVLLLLLGFNMARREDDDAQR